jgi:DNA-binding response OmpR family regulator
MQSNYPDEVYEFGPFRLSTLSWSLEYEGKIVHLPKLEFILLLTFLRNPTAFLTTSSLVPDVWPDEQSASHRALQEHVHRLNKVLKIGFGDVRLIQYVRGQGYKCLFEVRRLERHNVEKG